jgi:hypothetical protein
MYLLLKKHRFLIRPVVVLMLPAWPLLLAYHILKEEDYWNQTKSGYKEMLDTIKQGKLP